MTASRFSDWLAHRLMERGWNSVILAKKLGTAQMTVGGWLNDKRRPSNDLRPKIEVLFGTIPAHLVTRTKHCRKCRSIRKVLNYKNWKWEPCPRCRPVALERSA